MKAMTKQSIKRIYHTWDKWECYPAGFYENSKDGMTDEECRAAYRDFLADLARFARALDRVLTEWPQSCEHYLSNEKMNRIAWLGQAAACVDMGMPQRFRSGYFMLSKEQQDAADTIALVYLNRWLAWHGYETTNMEGAGIRAKVNLY